MSDSKEQQAQAAQEAAKKQREDKIKDDQDKRLAEKLQRDH